MSEGDAVSAPGRGPRGAVGRSVRGLDRPGAGPSRAMIAGRRGLLLVAAVTAVTGLLAGLARMGVIVGWGPRHAVDHGALLVVGVFGTVIALERAVALGRTWAYAAPALGAATAIGLLAGLPWAPWLGVGSAAVAVVINAAIVRRQAAAFTYLMLLGGVVRLLGDLAWADGRPVFDVVWAWSASFVLTIIAERLELSRLAPTPRWAQHLLGALALGLATATVVRLLGDVRATPVVGACLALLGAWQLRFDLARRTVRWPGLPRFAGLGVLLAAGWLVITGAFIARGPIAVVGPSYDVALHGVFVGYVLSMVFAHAPIILPAVARIQVRLTAAAYGPLALLHAGLLARVIGDVGGHPRLRQAGGVGSALALVAFALVIVLARRARVQAPARVLIASLLVVGAAGCVRVRAHQRETLAQPGMQAPVWPQVTAGDEHVFAVREGTGGAVASGGGGCGCN